MSEITEIRERWERYRFELNEEWRRKFTESAMLGNAAHDIDTLLAELARLQTECAALRAANADLHLIVDRTPEGDRHGKIAR